MRRPHDDYYLPERKATGVHGRKRPRIRLRKGARSELKTFGAIADPTRAYSRSDFEYPNLKADQRMAAECWDDACGRPRRYSPNRRLEPSICQANAAKQALLLVEEATRIHDAYVNKGWTGLAVTIVSNKWSGEDYCAEIHRDLKRDIQRWIRKLPYPAIFVGAIDVCKNRVQDAHGGRLTIWQPHCHGEIVANVPDGERKTLRSDLRSVVKATGRGEGVHKPLLCKKLRDPEGWRLYVAASLMLRGVTQRSQWAAPDGVKKTWTAPLSSKDRRQILLEWSRGTPQSRFVLAGVRKQGDRFVPTFGSPSDAFDEER